MQQETPIRPTDFGRLHDIPVHRIYRAIKAGIFQDAIYYHPDTRQVWLYPTVAKSEYDLRKDHGKADALSAGGAATAAKRGVGRPARPDKALPPPPAIPQGDTISELKRKTQAIKLQSDALTLQERRGALVDKSKVYAALFEFGKEMRLAIQTVPDRVVDAMLSAGNRTEAHVILTKELHAVLERMADAIDRDLIKTRK